MSEFDMEEFTSSELCVHVQPQRDWRFMAVMRALTTLLLFGAVISCVGLTADWFAQPICSNGPNGVIPPTATLLEMEAQRAVAAAPATTTVVNNKTLVIVIGQARGSEYAWRSLYWNLLRPYNADLATFFTSSSPRTVLQRMAKYNWMLPEFPNWAVFFELIAASCPMGPQDNAWQVLCRLGRGVNPQWMGGVTTENCTHTGSAGILLAMRWAVQQKLLELGLDRVYDAFVLTRADELYLCPHYPLSQLNSNFTWFPEGEEYGGVSDRHYFAHSQLFMRSLNMTQEFVCNYKHYIDPFSDIRDMNLERMIVAVFDRINVPIAKFKRSMFTVKLPTDPTRWSAGTMLEDGRPFGLLIKYDQELRLSKEYCVIPDIQPILRGFPDVPL